MSRDEKKEIKVREFIEYSGFKTWAAVGLFLQQLGKGIDDVERVVSDVNTGFGLIIDTGRRVIGALTQPNIDAEIERHRREIERLEEKKRENL